MKKKATLDTTMYVATVGQHPEQFNRCPNCSKYVPRKAEECWACGTNLIAEAIKEM